MIFILLFYQVYNFIHKYILNIFLVLKNLKNDNNLCSPMIQKNKLFQVIYIINIY